MIFTQLRSFHAVAREKGFTAASRVLNVGQPTLTSQVRALESMFHVELFHRRGREIALTEAGEALFAVARRIMDMEEEARDLLNAFGGFHTGTLHVGAVGPYHATEMLSTFNEHYPSIKLEVSVGNSSEMLERLFDYSVDVAVLAHVEDNPDVFSMPYSRHRVIAFVNKSHRFARRRKISFEELEGEPMVLRERGSTTRLAFEAETKRRGININPVMEIGSREAVWLAVARGIGIGVVSDIEYIPRQDIRPLEFSDADIYTTAHVNCLMERRESRLINAYFEIAELTRARER